MDNPLVVAALISMIGLVVTAIISGTFACLRNNRGAAKGNPGTIANGVLVALQAQTKALGDLTDVLREGHIENRQAHQKMIEDVTTLLERTKRNPE